MIYLIVDARSSRWVDSIQNPRWDHSKFAMMRYSVRQPPLFRVNREIRNEAILIFFADRFFRPHTHHLRLMAPDAVKRGFSFWFKEIGTIARHSLTRLEIYLTGPGGFRVCDERMMKIIHAQLSPKAKSKFISYVTENMSHGCVLWTIGMMSVAKDGRTNPKCFLNGQVVPYFGVPTKTRKDFHGCTRLEFVGGELWFDGQEGDNGPFWDRGLAQRESRGEVRVSQSRRCNRY